MRALIANVPKLQEPAEPASAEGSLLWPSGNPNASCAQNPPLPSEVHAIDLGPGAAALERSRISFTLELGDGGEHGTRKQAALSASSCALQRKGFSDFWGPAAFISGRWPLGIGSIGHCRKLLDVVALLRTDAAAEPQPEPPLRSLSRIKTPPSAAKSQ